jgi:hypothetical protein
MNYFLIGTKWADTYKNTDKCFNDAVGAADSTSYFNNFMFDFEKSLANGTETTYF